MEAPLPDKKSLKEHYAWRKRANRQLPKIAERVFALRKRFYSGCGFHYGMERELGKAIAMVNDFTSVLTLDKIVLEKIVVEALFKNVKEAEKSADELKGQYDETE